MGKTTLNWAIVAPGKIAEKFAESISSIAKKDNSIACYAVASRTKEKAQAFAEKWGFKKAYGSYEELFADPEADVVYIANPHPFHAELALHALAAGKHVLVEKPAAVNVQSLQQVIDFAQEKKLFFMEAFWTSCNPTVLDVLDLIRSGAIGSVTQANVNFCFRNRYDAASRLFNPELAGGALLDVGIYPLTFAMMVAHATDDMLRGRTKRSVLDNASVCEPRRIVSNARVAKGVDLWNAAELTFANGMTASLQSSVDTEFAEGSKDAFIYGTKGYIHLPLFWMAQEAELYTYTSESGSEASLTQKINHPFAVNGYEYEIFEVTKCVLAGKTSCLLHSAQDTLAVCKVMDALRSQWHLVYPFETTDTASVQNTTAERRSDAQQDTVVVYTDGGCSGNPGPGGWGCVILDGKEQFELSGGDCSTTNNKMELTAAISALAAVSQHDDWKHKKILVYSDSQYVKNGITSWIQSWKKNGWKTAAKKPVMNQELWEELDLLYTSLNVQWSWVKGHAGVQYNERCDALCQQEIRAQTGC